MAGWGHDFKGKHPIPLSLEDEPTPPGIQLPGEPADTYDLPTLQGLDLEPLPDEPEDVDTSDLDSELNQQAFDKIDWSQWSPDSGSDVTRGVELPLRPKKGIFGKRESAEPTFEGAEGRAEGFEVQNGGVVRRAPGEGPDGGRAQSQQFDSYDQPQYVEEGMGSDLRITWAPGSYDANTELVLSYLPRDSAEAMALKQKLRDAGAYGMVELSTGEADYLRDALSQFTYSKRYSTENVKLAEDVLEQLDDSSAPSMSNVFQSTAGPT